MNKTCSAILILFAAFNITHAQAIRSFGIKLGASTATQQWAVIGRGNHDYDYRWGVDLGGYVEWLESPMITILSEAHYIQKGMKYRFPRTPEDGLYDDFYPRIDYLSIPLLGKIRYDLGQSAIYAIFGPRFDILLSQDGAGFPLFAENKNTDYGATLGAGFQTSVASALAVGIELRYSPSFQNQDRDNFSVKNKSFEFLLTMGK